MQCAVNLPCTIKISYHIVTQKSTNIGVTIYSMPYQTHAFDAKLDHNGCVRYIRLIFNGYCFVGDAVFCQCRICRFSLCAGSKDDVSGIPFSFPHIAFVELFLISYFYYLEAFLDKVVFSPSSDALCLNSMITHYNIIFRIMQYADSRAAERRRLSQFKETS